MADDVAGAVRRTPRPTPYPRPAGDHQTPETGASVAPGATNTASPVSGDHPAVSSRVSSQDSKGVADAALAALRAKLREEPDALAACLPGPECDTEAYAALPPCMACEGGGQDTHGTVFEAPLAVHFAGPPVEIGGRRRQLCMWCGHVLLDARLVTHAGQPPTSWPVGALVRIEDGLGTVVPHQPGAELPPGCCALPGEGDEPICDCDPETERCPACADEPAHDGLDRLDNLCGKHVPGTSSNRCLLQTGHTGDCWDEFAPAPAPWGVCPNTPRCEHPSLIHDVSGDPEDPKPMCCADGCRCGQPEDGPDEAQETRAAAGWPAEPVDTRYDVQEADRA